MTSAAVTGRELASSADPGINIKAGYNSHSMCREIYGMSTLCKLLSLVNHRRKLLGHLLEQLLVLDMC
jgi:hypothetical protein